MQSTEGRLGLGLGLGLALELVTLGGLPLVPTIAHFKLTFTELLPSPLKTSVTTKTAAWRTSSAFSDFKTALTQWKI